MFQRAVLEKGYSKAYPSADIVDALPGVYQGVIDRGTAACEVKISKKLGMVDIQIGLLDESHSQLSFERVTNFRLKREYNASYEFRKDQDRSFNPETADAWLIYYVNHGIPSFFGVYPRTDKLEINWDKEDLYSVGVAFEFSDGGPYQPQPDTRNQQLECTQLKKLQ